MCCVLPGCHLCKWLCLISLSVCLAVVSSEGFASDAESFVTAKWSRLDYSADSWMGGNSLFVQVTPGGHSAFEKPVDGLGVQLQWGIGKGDFELFKRLKMRLHYPDGRVVEPEREFGPYGVSGYAYRHFLFPYDDNSLTEAWFELQIDDRTFWFDVPYGFTRNPEAPMPPSDPDGKPQGFVPAMSRMKKEDDIIRWSSVLYQFGSIQNGWDLAVSIRHGGMGGRVNLRRKEGRWAIHTPVTALKVEMENGESIVGEQIASQLEAPDNREDEFKFDFKPLSGRAWGKLVVTVDNVRLSQVVSLGTLLQGMWVPPGSR
jgi:hypothetical protein